jgi:hypothetical protein
MIPGAGFKEGAMGSRALRIALACLLSGALPALGAGTWQARAPMSTPRNAHAAGLLEGVIRTCGGHASGATTDACDTYDPITDLWSPSACYACEREEAPACAVNGRLCVFGGYSSVSPPRLDSVVAYDPREGRWVGAAPMPLALEGADCATWAGKIYVVGGMGDDPMQGGGVLEFTPPDPSDPFDTGSWRDVGWYGAYRGVLAEVVAGKMYATGGVDWFNQVQDAVLVYDLAADPISRTSWGTAPNPRGWAAATVLRGRIYFVGGRQYPPGTLTDLVEVLDPQAPPAAAWSTETPLPVRRGAMRAVAFRDEIFVTGGETGETNYVFTPGVSPACSPPVPAADGPAAGCEGDPILFDASASQWGGCPAADQRYVWEDEDGNALGVGPSFATAQLRRGFHLLRLVVWCASDPDCVGTLQLPLAVQSNPVNSVDHDLDACERESTVLDASPTRSEGCASSGLRFRWEDPSGTPLGTDAVLVTGALLAGANDFHLFAWCATYPDCVAQSVVTVAAYPDGVPPALGNVLRLDRMGSRLHLAWTPAPVDVGGYDLLRLDGDAARPEPAGMDAAPVVQTAAATATQAILVGGCAGTPLLAFFQLRAKSPCSLTPGPTCDGFPGQVPCP